MELWEEKHAMPYGCISMLRKMAESVEKLKTKDLQLLSPQILYEI